MANDNVSIETQLKLTTDEELKKIILTVDGRGKEVKEIALKIIIDRAVLLSHGLIER